MTDCKVTVSGENHEEERGSDLVDGGGGEVDLAHGVTERPLAEEHGGDKEGDPNEEALVRHSKVEDVSVCHLEKLMLFIKMLPSVEVDVFLPCAFLRSGSRHR